VLATCLLAAGIAQAELQVSGATLDISPNQLPVLVNGGMLSRTADQIHAPIFARATVFDNGSTQLAIVVAHSRSGIGHGSRGTVRGRSVL